jgi:hypothetical protein
VSYADTGWVKLAPWLLLALVVVGMSLVLLRIQFRRRATAEVRRAADAEPIHFEHPVGAKVRLRYSGWSLKTLGGMRLVVGEQHWSLVLRYRWLGALLGCNWTYSAAGTTISFGRLPFDPLRRDWIVLDATALPHGEALAVTLPNPRRAWDCLIGIGAVPDNSSIPAWPRPPASN